MILHKIGIALAASLFIPVQVDPPPALDLRGVIDIVADFEIQHPRVPYATTWYGLTDFDNQVVYTIKNADFTTRRLAMIHELIHVDRRAHGIQAGNQEEEEMAVRTAADVLYKQLFGSQ